MKAWICIKDKDIFRGVIIEDITQAELDCVLSLFATHEKALDLINGGDILGFDLHLNEDYEPTQFPQVLYQQGRSFAQKFPYKSETISGQVKIAEQLECSVLCELDEGDNWRQQEVDWLEQLAKEVF